MPVAVVDSLELIEIDEEHRRGLTRAAAAQEGMFEALEHENAIGEPGQGIVEGGIARLVVGVLEVGTRLGVDEVRSCHIGEGLGGAHRVRGQGSGCVSVEVEGSELERVVTQRKGEDGSETGVARARYEGGEALLGGHIRDQDRLPGFISRETGSFAELGLQLLETQCRAVRGGHIAGIEPLEDQCHPGRGHRHDVNDACHQVLEDPLDGKARHHRPGELA
ncbi:MAG TPA: hypothetical protein VG294_06775 [Solirubrobacteraceae bacterium]|nr:hypothetical protein [Solirubrobacteraceae bacterium]